MTDTRTTRIIGHMVVRNEIDRYLRTSVAWLRDITDQVFVFDDRSSDGTYQWLRDQRIPVLQRPIAGSSFAENEALFRGRAWRELEHLVRPTLNDWVLCIDADEFLVAEPRTDVGPTRELITDNIQRALHAGHDAITFPVREVFGFAADHTPMVRTDGYWGMISACRLVRCVDTGTFGVQREGGGSIPAGWADPYLADRLAILHLGYARDADRRAKHARYSTAGSGHNPRHVASILQAPTVKPWPSGAPA